MKPATYRSAQTSSALGILLGIWACVPVRGNEIEPSPPEPPQIAPASDAAEKAIAGFQVPEGLTVELVAAEPDVANPVCFSFDGQGRVYVAETFRQARGAEDNREHMTWVDDDLAARTIEDRLDYFRKHLGERVVEYTRAEDRIRRLEDTDSDGRFDRSSVFADRFNGPLEGIGAGVLAHQGDVYYTCIPNLWKLEDTQGRGVCDRRTVLSTGYGVHVAYRGHDMHGLCIGPDGKIYFSIGDRAFNVPLPDGRRLAYPDRGAVLRCWPDGSELEVVHQGLRNPQELAFDELGNLFTADNNCDSIDLARWVYIVDGGDSGWRMHYQYLADRGPWNHEQLWQTAGDTQPAWLLPPLAHIADGPAGLAYDPGVGLPTKYRGHFFLADFRGDPANSGVHSFALRPKGAAFELVDREQFFWGVLATDCDFSPDGSFHVLDWAESWEGRGKGRIYRLRNSEAEGEQPSVDSRQLLAADLSTLPPGELIALLAHADRRVRLAAQLALAERGATSIAALGEVAAKHENLLARLHAIWGLGIIARRTQDTRWTIAKLLVPLVDDGEPEVRAQACKTLGDIRSRTAVEPLCRRLADESPRVRLFAALALARIGDGRAARPALAMLRENADRDPYLRHAGVMILAATAGANYLARLSDAAAPAARLGGALALRRQAAPEIARFLTDKDPRIVQEAALAIYDVPIDQAEPQLAAILAQPGLTESAAWRALGANYRLGGAREASAVAEFAARGDAPARLRREAIAMLARWQQRGPRDRISGAWRPLAPRGGQLAAAAVQPVLARLLDSPVEIQRSTIELVGQLGIAEAAPELAKIVTDRQGPSVNRAAALAALAEFKAGAVADVVAAAVDDPEALVRAAAVRLMARLPAEQALPLLTKTLAGDSLPPAQTALAVLADLKSPAADEELARWLDRLIAGEVAPGLRLDLIVAATERGTPELNGKLKQFATTRRPDDPLAEYRECLEGGDAGRGRKIAHERVDLSCVRCHKMDEYGGLVGPDLSKIGGKQTREYVLEAVVLPNRTIAKGFESVLITTDEGQVISGVLRSEDADSLQLIKADGTPVTIAKSNIDTRTASASAMPADLASKLSKSELRDLVEFLASLK